MNINEPSSIMESRRGFFRGSHDVFVVEIQSFLFRWVGFKRKLVFFTCLFNLILREMMILQLG